MIRDVGDVKLPKRYLNAANDPAPGQIVSSTGISGSIVQGYGGQVGAQFAVSSQQASKLSDPDLATLYTGVYQYVQTLSTAAAAIVRGALAYWYDRTNYIVTSDTIATGTYPYSGQVAGVFLNTVTLGYYTVIQVAGYASILFKNGITASSTGGSPGANRLILADGTTTPRADQLNEASTLTIALAKLVLGVAVATPIDNTISLVDLWAHRSYIFGGGF